MMIADTTGAKHTFMEKLTEYWDRRPCNIRHGVSPVGTPEWSREVTVRKYFVEPHIPGFAQFERWRGKGVLEIGCGIGTDTLEFARRGAFIDAVDVSSESLKLAHARCAGFTGRQVMFFEMNAEERVPGRSCVERPYDLAYSFGVLHHTPHPEKVLKNVYEVMKSGAELRVMLYAKWSLKNLLGEQPEAQAGCPLARTYTVRAARRLLTRAGFAVESVQKTHIFPWRVKDYVQHRYVQRWPYRVMPGRLFRWLESVLGWHLLIVGRKA